MKITILLICLIISNITFSQELSEYDLKPYGDELNFKIIDENEILEKNDSLEAIIIVFNEAIFKNAEISIRNNPQLKQIKLFGSNQAFLKAISDSKLPNLTHLFFERYEDAVLEIPSFPNIEHLKIQSLTLTTLNMASSELNKLDILDIESPQLMNWKTAKFFPQLGLINLNAPLLENFPIENMPSISQFSYYCSFKKWPSNLCNYEELIFISLTNYHPIKVDSCLMKKIKNGVYSNLTIYDGIDGKMISETLSDDQK